MSQDFDEDEDWELEDDEDDDDIANEDPTRQLDVDVCPQNLDQKIYDDIVALREKRLDLGKAYLLIRWILKNLLFFISFIILDELIADEKAVLQSLQQTLGQTQIYSNKIDTELKSKHADLIDFQVKDKKQKKTYFILSKSKSNCI